MFMFRILMVLILSWLGGLLMMVPPEHVDALRAELEALDGLPTWVLGRVVEGWFLVKFDRVDCSAFFFTSQMLYLLTNVR